MHKIEKKDVSNNRIDSHPILQPRSLPSVEFTFDGVRIMACEGETIASALFASGIKVFGHHHKDGGAQGIFCANGQCSQCTVVADGKPVKSCMVLVESGMEVESVDGHPALPEDSKKEGLERPYEVHVPVLVLGGGPAGLCASIELSKLGVEVLVVDDKPELGGKLTLQTHGFFGSVADCYAGVRGVDIGHKLAKEVEELSSVEVWTDSTALGLFFDGKIGVATPEGYKLVTADSVLIAMGAREKALSFPGCDLPGIFGAGAFQTLVNRDLVRASKKLFILGGGNVGLIGAYHALQAGIDVVGLVEALPECGGYKVHADKIKRLGVPIWTGHTVLKAHGSEKLEKVTIAKINKNFKPIPGTEKTYEVDTLLIAVGLSSVDEILVKAKEFGLKVYSAGDSEEVAEASAAIFSGRIVGRQLAKDLGIPVHIPEDWYSLAKVLRSRPGETVSFKEPKGGEKVYPVIRCVQEIPCNPCSQACPEKLIDMKHIMSLPSYKGGCLGCGSCVAKCPGLAITLVHEDYDSSKEKSLVTMPFEFINDQIPFGKRIILTDFGGNSLGTGKVIAVREREDQDRRSLLMVEVPYAIRNKVAGFLVRTPSKDISSDIKRDLLDEEDPIICRCERVRKSDIVAEIRAGVRDINQLKAMARPSMGGCGGKTCTDLVMRIFREEGIDVSSVTSGTIRPLVAEVPLSLFVKGEKKDG